MSGTCMFLLRPFRTALLGGLLLRLARR